jgi:Flp pilus assembly protein TadG
MMRKLIQEERGNILALTALAMVCLIGFASLSIDVGIMLAARNQLQAAADAAALSGAMGLLDTQTECTARAIATASRNTCMSQPVVINSDNVTFPQPNQVMVQANRSVNLNFAGIIGLQTASVSATAVAVVGTLSSAKGLKPWGIPDIYEPGDRATIKAGELGAPSTNSSFFYPVDFPPVNRGTPEPGASNYEENIINGSDSEIGIGDILQVEPGNQVGPTHQGVSVLIGKDPGAYWDPSLGEYGGVANSNAGPDGSSASPRVVVIPMYDPDLPPDSGRNTISVTRLGVFFIDTFQGRDLKGYFMEGWAQGSLGGGNSMLKGVKLVL